MDTAKLLAELAVALEINGWGGWGEADKIAAMLDKLAFKTAGAGLTPAQLALIWSYLQALLEVTSYGKIKTNDPDSWTAA